MNREQGKKAMHTKVCWLLLVSQLLSAPATAFNVSVLTYLQHSVAPANACALCG
jgi:hypothetical protein